MNSTQFGREVRLFPTRVIRNLFVFAAALAAFGCQSDTRDANSLVGSPNGAKEVSFKTNDGWQIFADAYVPAGSSKGAVILLHQRNGGASDWKALCSQLQKAGYTALAIDQRGAGRSVQSPAGSGQKADDAPWQTGEDIAAAINFVADKGPVGLAGASYGANNALIYAAAHPDQIKGVALFSPGANYNGLDAVKAAGAWKGPIVIYHDKGDTIAGDGPAMILKATPSTDQKLVLSEGSRHGTELLSDAMGNGSPGPVAFFTRVLK